MPNTAILNNEDIVVSCTSSNKYPLKNFKINFALEEIKKEWEALDYKWKTCNNGDIIKLIKNNKVDIIYIYSKNKQYAKYNSDGGLVENFTFQEHLLLTKTFKALERYK